MATQVSASGTPWVERYRPKTLKDVSHQNEVVATLQNAVQTGRLPHLLFYGYVPNFHDCKRRHCFFFGRMFLNFSAFFLIVL